MVALLHAVRYHRSEVFRQPQIDVSLRTYTSRWIFILTSRMLVGACADVVGREPNTHQPKSGES